MLSTSKRFNDKISSEDLLKEMRELYKSGKFTYEDLSIKYGISKTTIHRAINRKLTQTIGE